MAGKMPKPVCITCNIGESLLWRIRGGGYLCNHCYKIETENGVTPITSHEPEIIEKAEPSTDANSASTSAPAPVAKTTKKGNRWTRARAGATATTATPGSANAQRGAANMRGRGRRAFFKKTPLKAPSATATIITSESIYYNGKYMQIGDIVSMLDEDGDTYYAQIRGFMTDQYCEKSAVVTWLLPTTASPPPAECFHPATYIIGPEEDLPRKLSCMEFIMHAPSEYYKSNNTPYPPTEIQLVSKARGGFIWSTMESKYK
ncbi:GATA zinc finger domain-containing protein 1-like [Arctopsyche grandis]|uniref:GATA zinc finger domain-containing protein 1-like n=1 Tax=Arctopsyche grandis TaxID=121162 RepID=UPI00406D64A6